MKSPPTGEDQDFVLGIRADVLRSLAKRPMVLHAELNRAAHRVRLRQEHAVRAALQPEMVLESFPVLLEAWGRYERLE